MLIFIDYSVTTESKIHDFSGGMFNIHAEYIQVLKWSFGGFITISFTKDEKDNIGQLDDYDAPFCEQQYKHGSCCISLFKFKSFDQFNSPELPQILDIYSVVAL